MEPEMAFLDDARHTGRPLCASDPLPRQFYTLAMLGTSLLIWTILLLTLIYLV